MTEHAPLPDPNEPPEDVASLYSWANLHGGKYRDFSASRAEIREKTRQRTEEAIEQERLRAQQEAEAQPAAEAARGLEELRRREFAAQQAAQSAAQIPLWNVHAKPRSWPSNAPHNRRKPPREPGNKRHGNGRRRIAIPRRLPTSNLHHRQRPLPCRKAQLLRSARRGFQPMQTKTPVAPHG